MTYPWRSRVLFLVCLALASCDDDSPSLGEGESRFDLTLSGGAPELDRTRVFRGRSDELTFFLFDTVALLASDPLGVPSDPSGYSLGRMTLEVDDTESGVYGTDAFDIDLVVHGFSNAQGTTAYSLRERDGSGTVTVVSAGPERVRLRLAFDASPTQLASTDLVFHLEGEIEVRR